MRKCNYDKYPSTRVEGEMIRGWEEIIQRMAKEGEKGLLGGRMLSPSSLPTPFSTVQSSRTKCRR